MICYTIIELNGFIRVSRMPSLRRSCQTYLICNCILNQIKFIFIRGPRKSQFKSPFIQKTVTWIAEDARAHTEETARTAGGQVRIRKQPIPMGLRHPHQLLDESRNPRGTTRFIRCFCASSSLCFQCCGVHWVSVRGLGRWCVFSSGWEADRGIQDWCFWQHC